MFKVQATIKTASGSNNVLINSFKEEKNAQHCLNQIYSDKVKLATAHPDLFTIGKKTKNTFTYTQTPFQGVTRKITVRIIKTK